LAHELGHILMHHPTGIPRPEEEVEADGFASELLMPEKEIRYKLTGLKLQKLVDLKIEWKVAMSALARRAFSLKKITERQYRYLCMQMAQAGYRRHEPASGVFPRETPTLLSDLIKVYFSNLAYSEKEICQMLCLFPDEFRVLYNPENREGKKKLELIK